MTDYVKTGKKLCDEDVSKIFLRNVGKYIYRTTRCIVPKELNLRKLKFPIMLWPQRSVKVKDSCNRRGVLQRVPGGLDSQIFMTFGT